MGRVGLRVLGSAFFWRRIWRFNDVTMLIVNHYFARVDPGPAGSPQGPAQQGFPATYPQILHEGNDYSLSNCLSARRLIMRP